MSVNKSRPCNIDSLSEDTVPVVLTVNRLAELELLVERVKASAKQTSDQLIHLLKVVDGVDLFSKLRFEEIGCDPLDPNRPLNFIEQLNQTSSYLVSFGATAYLLKHHGASAPFTLRLGPIRGYDITSADGQVVAETFAAVSPDSNQKLKQDTSRVKESNAEHKYVFYYCPGFPSRVAQVSGVTTVSLGTL